jgi:hypothetical protein
VLWILALRVRAVEALVDGVHARQDRRALAVAVLEIVVPHVRAVAETVPREEQQLLLALVQWLLVRREAALAVLLLVVLKGHLRRATVALGDVRPIVTGGGDADKQRECHDVKRAHLVFH